MRDRGTVIQKKTGRPVQFEITEQTRSSIRDWLPRDKQDERLYCLTGECYPKGSCCLTEMLPLPHALGTEVPNPLLSELKLLLL